MNLWAKPSTSYHKNQNNLQGQYTNPNRGRYDGNEMAKLKTEAENYVPPTTKNITELDEVPVDIDVLEKEGEKKNGEKFKYKYVLVKDEEYRLPNSVIGQLKEQLKNKPDMEKFKVTKTGEALKTVYTVIPL